MWPNQKFPANWGTFTEETVNGKLCFLCSVVATLIQPGGQAIIYEGNKFTALIWPVFSSKGLSALDI